MKKYIITTLLILTSLCGRADGVQKVIDIKTDNYTIYTDSLGLPMSTTAYEVLSLLPELVERTKDYILQNYEILINGATVGNARDAVLQQMCISDISSIQVYNNSLSSVTSMGQGGSINLVLRPIGEKVAGSANAEANTNATYSGGLRLDIPNKKWSIRGLATISNNVPRSYDTSSSDGTQTSRTLRNFSQIAAAFVEYHPSANDVFNLNVSEVYTNNRLYLSSTQSAITTDNNQRTRNVDAFVGLEYSHTFPSKTNLSFEFDYRFIPEKYDGYKTDVLSNDYDHKAHNLLGCVKVVQPLLKKTPTREANLEVGTQYNVILADNTNGILSLDCENPKRRVDESNENTYYLRPYFKFNAKWHQWQMYLNADYQHFVYDTKMEEAESHSTCNNITGQAVLLYSPDSRNTLRLRYVRSIKRPSSTQLFPILFYDIMNGIYHRGNPDLTPMPQNAVDLDYNLNLSTSTYNLDIKAGVEYSRTFDQIKDYSSNTGSYISNTYINSGKSDVIIGNLGLYYRKQWLSVWLTGNLFHKMDNVDDGDKDHYTYYNILLRPVFNLGHGWIASLSAAYNSSITTATYRNGSHFYGDVRLAKTWRHFDAYVYGKQNFIGDEKNVTYLSTGNISTNGEYMHSNIGAGVRYYF